MFSRGLAEPTAFFSLPPELSAALLAATPLIEMRGAIPVAHGILGLPWAAAFFWGWLGSTLPGAAVLALADRVINWCNRKSPFCSRIIGKTLERTRRHFHKEHEKFGEIGLLVFVAIPLPLTGVWSGALAAVLFGIPYWRALALIAAGNAIAGLIITLAASGLFKAASFL